MTPIESLLAVSDAYASSGNTADERRLSESRISTIVFNDGKRLKSVRAGADIGGLLIAKGLQWFSDNWPASAIWPDRVSRPARTAVPADAA